MKYNYNRKSVIATNGEIVKELLKHYKTDKYGIHRNRYRLRGAY